MNKHERMVEFARQFEGQGVDPRYAGYFALFNEQKFYEAHDVLEDLWLADKLGPDGNFYKGLIQLAGAFVHLQKQRLKPSAALFRLAGANLAKYPAHHERLDLSKVHAMISAWLKFLEENSFREHPFNYLSMPKMNLL